jgi:hypothetical protein
VFHAQTREARIPIMESVVRKVRDIDEDERQVLERVLGRELKENQQVIIQVVTPGKEAAQQTEAANGQEKDDLPEWCNVYEGLTDQQIADVDAAIRERANLTRPS